MFYLLALALLQDEDLKSGLVTTSMLEAEPPGLRVSWIHWDSGFRGSGLLVGDRIVAVDGRAIVRPKNLDETRRVLPRMIGQYAESQGWKARDGAAVTLRVRRRASTGEGVEHVEIRGTLRKERAHFNKDNAPTLGPGGPPRRGTDNFADSWLGWYEKQMERGRRVLDGGWQNGSLDSRMELKRHLSEQERLDYLVQKYPGPFAAAMREDWELVRDTLAGRKYELGDADLAFRQLGELRAKEVAEQAKKAREEFLLARKSGMIEPFPTIDPIHGDRKTVTGKIVLLPGITSREWVMEGPRAYLFSGGRDRGFYFVDSRDPGMTRVLEAAYRYKKYVTPKLDESYAIVGRILPDPKMLVIQGRAQTGLAVEVLAATVGEALFVDATVLQDRISPFAGEADLRKPADLVLPPDASPRKVMETFISALKEGDEQTWKGLFAPWRAAGSGTGRIEDIVYYPRKKLHFDEPWIASRRLLMDRVCDVRVVYVSVPTTIITGKEFERAPVVEEVWVELEHVGRFDGEFRAFTSVAVHRIWRLQRVDGGPWRIAEIQQL